MLSVLWPSSGESGIDLLSSSLWLSLHVLKLALQARKRQTVDRGWSLLTYLTDARTKTLSHAHAHPRRMHSQTLYRKLQACTERGAGCMRFVSMHKWWENMNGLLQWFDSTCYRWEWWECEGMHLCKWLETGWRAGSQLVSWQQNSIQDRSDMWSIFFFSFLSCFSLYLLYYSGKLIILPHQNVHSCAQCEQITVKCPW